MGRFLATMADMLERHDGSMSGWTLAYDGFDPARESLREALCTLGNGYFATRGAAEESEADDVHYPGTYLAGGYNRLGHQIAGRRSRTRIWSTCRTGCRCSFRLEGATG